MFHKLCKCVKLCKVSELRLMLIFQFEKKKQKQSEEQKTSTLTIKTKKKMLNRVKLSTQKH